jgi:hypothetical protein
VVDSKKRHSKPDKYLKVSTAVVKFWEGYQYAEAYVREAEQEAQRPHEFNSWVNVVNLGKMVEDHEVGNGLEAGYEVKNQVLIFYFSHLK